MATKYDLIVIGGGSAGSAVAKKAAKDGRSVALVERNKLGGTCLNAGCDPTKAMLYVAQRLYDMRNGESIGLTANDIRFDWSAVRAYVGGLIDDIRGGDHDDAVQKQEDRGISVYLEEASFHDSHTICVGNKQIEGENILIATGAVAHMPKMNGLNRSEIWTNWDALKIDTLPKRLAIVGGGAQGVEFAQMFHRFGVEITLLQRDPRILTKDEGVLASSLQDILKDEGIMIHCNAEACGIARRGDAFEVSCVADNKMPGATTDAVLITAGRRPAIEGLNLDAAGVAHTDEGIETDDQLRTNVAHIWAAGDVIGEAAFTHVASSHADTAYHNMFAKNSEPVFSQPVPWVTYSDPALANIGPTTDELQAQGIDFDTLSLDMSDIVRAKLTSETNGSVMLHVDKNGKILAGHILGRHADDLIAPVILAVKLGITADEIKDTMLPYPTRAEAIRWAAAQYDG